MSFANCVHTSPVLPSNSPTEMGRVDFDWKKAAAAAVTGRGHGAMYAELRNTRPLSRIGKSPRTPSGSSEEGMCLGISANARVGETTAAAAMDVAEATKVRRSIDMVCVSTDLVSRKFSEVLAANDAPQAQIASPTYCAMSMFAQILAS